MNLKIQKKFEQDKSSEIIIDNQCWGALTDKALLPLFPIPFEGEIESAATEELITMLQNRAREQLLRYLADSEHSSWQCKEYLKRKSYHPAIINPLLQDFAENKYLDDARYVRILIGSLIDRQKSRTYIIGKLRESRLPASLWEEVLQELYNPEDSLEGLKEQVLKLRLRYSELDEYKQKEKVLASLFRKGFDLDSISRAWKATKS
ncbi:MAG: regulatory protein RecX [Candidatus Cloacimonas sp.]|jgi:regulatory protein|nr:regulatory protein RecX [Candidatus Cloacimonas sp.]